MSKAAPPPLLGFNNNVRHRGRIFHIQTEDSGVKLPRIVTHLFADGGRIVRTTRTDYSEHLEKTDMAAVVRGMMKEQHKGMFAALRAGEMDPLLENVCGPLDPIKSQAPAEPSSLLPGPVAPAAQITQPAPVADAQAVIDSMRSRRDSDESPRSRRPISNPNLRKPTPSVAPPPAEAFDLDLPSLDKNPPKSDRAPPRAPARPPSRKSEPVPRKSPPPIPVRAAAAPLPGSAAASGADVAAMSRPQTRLAAAPPSSARSIFGDGAISEQSLDEVILSYLAEDLEETK